ncbi:MAG: hypothetical protein ACRDY4_11175 [Acidimicrobiia bacterium]
MRARHVAAGGALAIVGAAAAASRLVRALPLVNDLVANDGGGSMKDEKKDIKKKGNGPRTRRKKAKKGK